MIKIEEYIKKDIDKASERNITEFSHKIAEGRNKASFSFLFATDLHYKSNEKLTFGTMKKLREMVMCAELTKPDLFVLNGDLTDGHSEKSVILSELSALFDNLKALEIPIIINKGNHDSATWFAYGAKSSEYIKNAEWNEIISKITKRSERGYGYLDFDMKKIRIVYLNTSDITDETDELGRIASSNCQQWHLGMSKEQICWLGDVLSDCPKGYGVIFFSHYIPFGDNVENGGQVWDMIKDFNSENRVLAYMYGHKHKDFTENRDGITCICTKDMMNASVKADDGREYCATLKDIPVICSEPVLNNPKAQILGGWDYIEITEKTFKSIRFSNEGSNREIFLK